MKRKIELKSNDGFRQIQTTDINEMYNSGWSWLIIQQAPLRLCSISISLGTYVTPIRNSNTK